MRAKDFADLLALGGEQPNLEFKGPGPRTAPGLFMKVLRAVLAMANRRDGGYVIVGVGEDADGRPVPVGLTPEDLATWRADNVKDAVAPYADPSVDIDVVGVEYEGRHFVAIVVREFPDVPVVCRRAGGDERGRTVVREGAIYVRSRRKPESVELPGQAEARDLVELATEKRMRSFLATAQAVGLGGAAAATNAVARSTSMPDNERYRAEWEALTSPTVSKARSRGHWDLAFWPDDYRQRIDNISELFPLALEKRVMYRGWPYPGVLTGMDAEIGADWAGQSVDNRMHVEGWRLHQSGLFHHVLGFWDDWYDQDTLSHPTGTMRPEPGTTLLVEGALYTLTEFFEFCARLAVSPLAANSSVRLRLEVRQLQGRALRLSSRYSDFITPPTASLEQFEMPPFRFDATDLAASPWEHAAVAARELFRRFGWDPELDILHGIQQELRRR